MTDLQRKSHENQQAVKREACQYILSEREDIVITGPAGHGKSHVCGQIVESVAKPHSKILVCALAHEALGVAKNFLGNFKYEYSAETIAAALQCRPVTDEHGVTDFVPVPKYIYSKKGKRTLVKPPLALADYIIIDECSQVSHRQLMIIEKIRKPNSIIIFVGDICQLPPIERKNGELFSPVFKLKTFKLLYPYRYGGEISEIGELFRTEIYKGLDGKEFDPLIWKQLENQKLKHLRITYDKYQFAEEMIEEFKKNPLGCKFISYTQYSYKEAGRYIRSKLNPQPFHFEPGDFVVSKTNYYENNILKLNNGELGEIRGKRKMRFAIVWITNLKGVWQFQDMAVKYSSKANLRLLYSETINIDVSKIKIEELEYWCHDINDKTFIPTSVVDNKRFKEIINYLSDHDSLHALSPYERFWDAKNALIEFFCEIQYTYGGTSHTSQGKSYDYVFPSFKDIFSVKNQHTSQLERLQSSYVAVTRARNNILCLAE